MYFFTTWALIFILLAILWLLPTFPLKVAEDISSPSVVPSPSRTTCPFQIKKPTLPSTAVTDNETFFVVESLSSSLSPVTPANIPPIRYVSSNTVLVNDELCFLHLGDKGGLTIVSKFLQYRITHFTIDNSAANRITLYPYHPKEGTLWGLIEGDLPSDITTESVLAISDKAAYIALGRFCFDPFSSVSQTYSVEDMVVAHDQLRFSVFYLEIENNWGGSHTCLCHIKLHGEG